MKYKNKALRVACDGESSSGKSLASKLIGRKFRLFVLNSGLAYRYASFLIIKHQPKEIIPFLKKNFRNLNYKKLPRLNLHTQEISNYVVTLSKKKQVRQTVRVWQQRLINKHSRIVVEGRDSASTILKKKYDIAFYFTCSLKIASLRRWRDLKKKVPLKEIKKTLAARTLSDKMRKNNPLKKMSDAVLIRTDILGKKAMIAKMSKEINKKLLLKNERNYKAR